MIASAYINDMVPSVRPTDPIGVVLDWMAEFGLRQLPFVQEEHYAGICSEEALQEAMEEDKILSGEVMPSFQELFAEERMHIYDVLRLAGEYALQVVPVVGQEKKYIGCIDIRDLTGALARMFAGQFAGGIVVLKMDAVRYSLSEISRLVEANNARVLSSFAMLDEAEPAKMVLTLRLNTHDLTHILPTFERFGYHVAAKFNDVETRNNNQERLNLLLKYLEF